MSRETMARGLGRRRGDLLAHLLDLETSKRPEKAKGLSTNEIAALVFGKRFSPADRVQTARALGVLSKTKMVFKIENDGARFNVARWRIHPTMVIPPLRKSRRRRSSHHQARYS
jgi:hypothetical protein